MTAVPSARTPRFLPAWSALALAVVGAVFTVIESPTLASALFGGMFIAFPVVGLVLKTRVRHNAIGDILLAIGAFAGVGGVGAGIVFLAPADSFIAGAGRWLQTWLFYPIIGLVLSLLLLFPTGRVLSRQWRWALWTAPLFVLVASVGAAFYPWPLDEGGPNPLAVEGLADTLLFLQDVSGIPLFAGVLAGIASLVIRFRRGSQVERQQIKWFLTASALLPIAIGVGDEYREIQGIIVPFAFILFPLAIGVAITRYRLYDIDRIVSRTVTYAAVTALLVGAYAAVVFAVGRLFPSQDSLAVVASTLTVAALFNPLRRRIQRAVDQRFNRPRYDAERTVEEFGRRLRGEGTPLESLEEDLVGIVATAMQPTSVSVWVKDEPA